MQSLKTNKTTISLFLSGMICGLAFAPIFFVPGIFTVAILCGYVQSADTKLRAIKYGYSFGFGYFLIALYWISFGPATFADEFWWAVPIALIGLPAFMAVFIAIVAVAAWFFRGRTYYHIMFCVIWVAIEWVTSWIFTGLPWALIGYSLAFSDILLQAASMFSIFGLSFLTIYVGSSIYCILQRYYAPVFTSILIIIVSFIFGYKRLQDNPTEFQDLNIRVVQPSIPQNVKWSPEIFWNHLYDHINLSRQPGSPDIIVWSEAAITAQYDHAPILSAIKTAFTNQKQILISGASIARERNYYSALLALDANGDEQFEYHKSHLVPFGEYMPFRNFIPLKKFTYGLEDYTEGKRKTVFLQRFGLTIQPLICYEAIFPFEVMISNQEADLFINVSNDAWYGNSSGPYQHFYISKLRAIENGIPLIRATNNGISAILDPVGRQIGALELQQIGFLDGKLPKKLKSETIFTKTGYFAVFILLLIVVFAQFLISKINKLIVD